MDISATDTLKPPKSRLRRRLAVVLLAAAVGLAWFVAPSREEWRLSGTWHLPPDENGVTRVFRLRWWGSASLSDFNGRELPLRWRVADDHFELAVRVEDTVWGLFEELMRGGSLFEAADVFIYRLDAGGLRLFSAEGGRAVVLTRTPQRAGRVP